MSYSREEGLARLIWEYQDSPNVRALIASILSQFDDIGEALEQLRTRLDIDVSVGAQLDGIGEIVGQPRPSNTPVIPDDVFAFDGPTVGLGFSGLLQPTTGGQFIGVSGSFLGPMIDADYRTVLRAAIAANIGLSTSDHIAQYCQIVLGAVAITSGIGVVNISISRPITDFERDLIERTAPVAAGIRIGYISNVGPIDPNGGFAFGGVNVPQGPLGGFDDVAGSGSAYSGGFVGIV